MRRTSEREGARARAASGHRAAAAAPLLEPSATLVEEWAVHRRGQEASMLGRGRKDQG